MGPATRKKRVSKKNKKSWRKNVDISDVDGFFEELRRDEREGGSITLKPDEELFKIDTDVTKKETLDENVRVTKRGRRQNPKPLRCFEALNNTSCVPDPIKKRNRVIQPGERATISLARRKQEQVKFLRKNSIAQQDRSIETSKRIEFQKSKESIHFDLWADKEESILHGDTTWLKPQTLVHTVQHIAKKIGKKSNYAYKKNSALPAISAPHPGESYNPSLGDYQDLVQQVAEKEREVIKQEKHIDRVLKPMYAKHSERPTAETQLSELAEGLPFMQTDDKEEEIDNSDSEYRALNPPVKNRKKTRQQRRRLKEAHIEMLAKEANKVEKKKISDIYQLRKLHSEMTTEAAEQERLRALRQKVKQYRAVDTKQMSRFKFEEPDIDFNMPQELKGNMRNVKVEGSILLSQFKSLQKRNIIETRIRQKRTRKYKLKTFTKASHKVDV